MTLFDVEGVKVTTEADCDAFDDENISVDAEFIGTECKVSETECTALGGTND